MELNYLILAHTSPAQLKRLIQALSAEHCRFFVHVDAKVDIVAFQQAVEGISNVYLLPNSQRSELLWGDISIVKATLTLLKEAISQHASGYCILLSGQDYPIKSNDFIHDFLAERYGINFIYHWPMPHWTWGPFGGMERIELYKVDLSARKHDYVLLYTIFQKQFFSRYSFRAIMSLIKRGRLGFLPLLIKRRRLPGKLKPYGGWQWWALPIESVHKITQFVEEHPEYYQFHRFSSIPDELFFQTLLLNLDSIPSSAYQPGVTHMRWIDDPSPKVFETCDFEELLSQPNKLFARKFSAEIDSNILDLLDKRNQSPKHLSALV